MGCGTSINENDVKVPKSVTEQTSQVKAFEHDKNDKSLMERKNVDLKQMKTQKSIAMPDSNPAANSTTKVILPELEENTQKHTNIRLYLFGQSKEQRKIIQFQALPSPHIEILLSRTNNLPPVKYQPSQIILQQSQQLTSSHLYISTSHPPYNYMYSTFVKSNTIFLCGGVNFNFQNVSNEAFLFYIKEQQINLNTPHKKQKNSIGNSTKKQRRIGNNLMGSKFQRMSLMKYKRYSHMGVFFKAGKLGYIYIFGGRNQADQTLSKCEKYSIQQDKWTEIASLNAPRSTGFSIIVNKKIYVFGGYTHEGKRSKKIEKYNPGFDNWEVLNIKIHKGIQTGLILPCHSTSEILIVGGNVEYGSIKSVIKINFENETYNWDSDLKKERLLQKGIALLQENAAYILGGDFQDTIQKYSYKDKSWKVVSGLTYGQCVCPDEINAFTLAQQTVQLSFNSDSGNLNSSPAKQQENILTGQFRYVFGTDDYPSIYQINTAKWVVKKKNVPMALRLRCNMTASKIKEGKIFLGGGIDAYFQKPSRAAYIYYPGTNKAIQIAKMKQKKYAFSACSYNNFVYIFGGQDGKEGKVLSTVEKYDLTENKWIQLAQLPRQRAFSKAVMTPTKKILLIGGTDCLYQTVTQIDVFDIETQEFSTLDTDFPLACQLKYVGFTNNVVTSKRKENTKQFQFLDEEQQKKKSILSEVEEKEKIEKIGVAKPEEIKEYFMIVFGYNSYKKEDQAYLMSLSADSHKLKFDQKSYKLYPYSLTFSIPSAGQKENTEDIMFYYISNKGVFKWDESTKQMNSQIVINQMHLLQMPIEKFCIA